ncbi:calcineurin-like phosphoesterase C-terminal domain-containing protein [Arthrobacter castelli]|uniref:calcineurin-like phosphoesterase C-terminal domain-containing protein n=1 Tax=Arthrobacter castelli TaxID=271431 RepID=UPI000686A7F9|nr:calcineurin-like phosphoesterase family protein [Arthrobacter castelli]
MATPPTTRSRRPIHVTAGTLALAGALLAPGALAAPAAAAGDWDSTAYRGDVHVVEGPDETRQRIDGTVFVDRDKDSVQDPNERGLGGVTVSNGREVTTTDSQGNYELPAFENMTVFVTQPRGYQVPVDEDNVAQFSYHHLPEGSPDRRYGGIAPTGPLADAVNFPLAKSSQTRSPEQHCAILADVQTYNQTEVTYAAKGAFADLAARTDYAGCGALFLGDVVGDDLSLYSETRELAGMLNGPARFLPGNHDLDYDAVEREHAFDTFKAKLGPDYYSYDVGKAHIVALNTVGYPLPGGGYSNDVDPMQMEWLRNDIAQVPENKVIVLAGHMPLLEFYYSDTHRVNQVKEIYEILEGREVVSIGGHTHMMENLREGDLMAGWTDIVGPDGLPFPHLTVGAVSGNWYGGRLLEGGYPTALQRDGTPPGVLTLDIMNTEVTERYTVRGDESAHMAVGLNTPRYRDWYAANVDNKGSAPKFTNPLTVSRQGLANDTWLTTNFWIGGTGSTVEVAIDGGRPVEATRTQPMNGGTVKVGAEWSDPVAVQEQLAHGGGLADRMMHLWRLELPDDLAVGEHTAKVTATGVHGKVFTKTITFTVTK